MAKLSRSIAVSTLLCALSFVVTLWWLTGVRRAMADENCPSNPCPEPACYCVQQAPVEGGCVWHCGHVDEFHICHMPTQGAVYPCPRNTEFSEACVLCAAGPP